MLKDNCGCGQCTFMELITNGCPKPLRSEFLYLDHCSLTQNEKDILVLKLHKDAEVINTDYRAVVCQFKAWINENLSINSYRELLSGMGGSIKKNVPFLRDRWKDIKYADHNDCSALLSEYHSWFNCSILEQVLNDAKTIGKDPTKVLFSLKSYTEKMIEYCKRNIFECSPPSDMSSTKGTTYCVFKLMDVKLFTADEIRLLTAKIMTLCNVKEYSLQLCTFTEGCVELVYSTPLCIYAELFPFNEDHCIYLTTLGVTEITTKDYHYKLEHVSNTLHGCACRSPHIAIKHSYINVYSIEQAKQYISDIRSRV